MKVFDESFIVVTHRDPVFTVPSFAKLTYFIGNFLFPPFCISSHLLSHVCAHSFSKLTKFRSLPKGSLYVRDTHTSALTRYMTKDELGKDLCESLKIAIDSMYRFRERDEMEGGSGGKRVMDVEYDDLIRDPIGVVREIYRKAGLVLTEEAEEKMKGYLEKNKREREGGKGSTHSPYSLEEFGIDSAYVKNVMREYRERRGYTKKD